MRETTPSRSAAVVSVVNAAASCSSGAERCATDQDGHHCGREGGDGEVLGPCGFLYEQEEHQRAHHRDTAERRQNSLGRVADEGE
jgi:hypothetical protein